MDLLRLATLPLRPFSARCTVPRDLADVTTIAPEVPSRDVGVGFGAVQRLWQTVEELYRTGLYPAIQLCIRRHGEIVLHRAIGHSHGNLPGHRPSREKVLATPETPFLIYSASKAVTAMLIHKLDQRAVLDLDDRVCDYVPEFAANGKDWITLRHVLVHRAGIPNLPPEALDLELLADPGRVVRILCDARPVMRAGTRLAYHAVTGGFILGEVVRRATGESIRDVLRKEIQEPMGLRWTGYGVRPEDVSRVAEDAVTGLPVPFPVSVLLRRALGANIERVVELANDPRFRTGVIPAANVVTTAEELSAFYQCLLDGGVHRGERVFDPRTVRRAVSEQSYWELDFTLGVPLRYGLGFMLGGDWISLYGRDTSRAFGHLGFTNIFSWADPERRLSVALLTSGKPIANPEVVKLVQLILAVNETFPKVDPRRP